MVEVGEITGCYPLAITGQGPRSSIGHASLLVGNAFIVHGGDTKVNDSDILYETLYLLNISRFINAGKTTCPDRIRHKSMVKTFDIGT